MKAVSLARTSVALLFLSANITSAEIIEVWADKEEWNGCLVALKEQFSANADATIYMPPAALVGPEPIQQYQEDPSFGAVLKLGNGGEDRPAIIPEGLHGYRFSIGGTDDGKTITTSLACLIDTAGTVRIGNQKLIGVE